MLNFGMQLDKFTDFGLRILMTLAAHAPVRMPTSAIAQIFDLSEHHLAKVASELARGGFVVSERGRNGGLVLARPAPDINVGSVVRYLQKDRTRSVVFWKRYIVPHITRLRIARTAGRSTRSVLCNT